MLIAGAFVGFLYNTAGIQGILAIDGATYFVSAYCLYRVRRGYVSPRESQKYPREYSEATEATAEALETGENPEVAEAGLSRRLRGHEGGVRISEATAAGACAGHHARHHDGGCSERQRRSGGARKRHPACRSARPGLSGSRLGHRRHHRRTHCQPASARVAHAPLCCGVCRARGGPSGDSVRRVSCGRRDDANPVWILPRAWWSRGAVFVDDHRAKTFYGTHAIRDGDSDYRGTAFHEFFSGMGGTVRRPSGCVGAAGRPLHRRYRLRHPPPPAFALELGP